MDLVARDELAELTAQAVIRIAANVVKFVNRDQPIVERLDAQFIDGEPEGRVRAHQHWLTARKEFTDRFNLGFGNFRLIDPRRIAEVPLRLDCPIRPESVCRQLLIGEAAADRALRHDDNCLAQGLIVELVEGNEHQRPGLPGSWRRLDQQILLTPPGICPLLHWPHAKGIGPGRGSSAGRRDRDRWDSPLVRGVLSRHAAVLLSFFTAGCIGRHPRVKLEQLLQPLGIVTESPPNIDAFQHFIIFIMRPP